MVAIPDDIRRQLSPPRLPTLFLQTVVGPDTMAQVSFNTDIVCREDIDCLIKNLVLAQEILPSRESKLRNA